MFNQRYKVYCNIGIHSCLRKVYIVFLDFCRIALYLEAARGAAAKYKYARRGGIREIPCKIIAAIFLFAERGRPVREKKFDGGRINLIVSIATVKNVRAHLYIM